MTRRILVAAYACSPGRGSEPGVGWHVARAAAERAEVWVLTMPDNRAAIEAELARAPHARLHPVYWDLPWWLPLRNSGRVGAQLHYYAWQLGAVGAARALHRQVRFDLVHHVTFVKYWMPSVGAFLPAPFVWGPVGGGESAPKPLWRGLGVRGTLFETFRELARWLGERDPLVRLTARRSAVAVATTRETAVRLHRLGARDVRILPESGVSAEEFAQPPATAGGTADGEPPRDGMRLISVGRLLHWKGFHLGLRAFARLPESSEYWIVGAGPDERRLRRLARKLGVMGRVRFLGALPRSETMDKLRACDVLVHPSLHDSGGWVCLEAMAQARPVACLALGGPALQVTNETGRVIEAHTLDQVVDDLAAALNELSASASLRKALGASGRDRVARHFSWATRPQELEALYGAAVSTGGVEATVGGVAPRPSPHAS
ncbi:MAG TPA: glycosyltransferase family 4 protein [Gemmatirosa sp.]|nr:glycosyltransferase family 4 protein [Gemmatirosa sp.]